MTPKQGAAQRVLLGLEFCISIAAVVYFSRANLLYSIINAFRNQGCTSSVEGEMRSSAKPSESQSQMPVDSNFAIATLSLVVFVVRIVMLRLTYLTQSASIFYDMLMSFLWIVSMLQQINFGGNDTSCIGNHLPWSPDQGFDTGNKGVCHPTQISFAISILAGMLYGGRMLYEMVNITAYALGLERRAGWEAASEGDGYRDTDELSKAEAARDLDKVYAEALSPVLAFFPEDTR